MKNLALLIIFVFCAAFAYEILSGGSPEHLALGQSEGTPDNAVKAKKIILKTDYENVNASCGEKKYITVKMNGETRKLVDFRTCVNSSIFEQEMKDVYSSYSSDLEFLTDLQYSLMNTVEYKDDPVGEDRPQHPVSTLRLGTGDCEDAAILMASMLKAVSDDWRVEFVVIDNESPKKLEGVKNINHVLLRVDTGGFETLVETTHEDGVGYYDEVDGWYFEI